MANELRIFQNSLGGRLKYALPASSTIVTDGATTNADATVTSATAAFTAADVGAPITGTGIPAGAYIASINSATSVEISANATATGSGVTLTISREKVIHSDAFAAMSTIGTTQHMMLCLNPDGINTAPEYVMVTKHDASATWAQATRAQEGSTSYALPNSGGSCNWVHGPLISDVDLPTAKGYRNAALNAANITFESCAFDTEVYDTHGIFNPANGRFTVPTGWAGIWRFTWTVGWSANTSGQRNMNAQINGTTLISHTKSNASSSGSSYDTASFERRLAVGDYVELGGTQNSGGALAYNVGNEDSGCNGSATFVRRA